MSYVLGIDLGTSSLKGVVMTKIGTEVASATSSYPLLVPEKGYSEQDPLEWITAFRSVIQELLSKWPDLKGELEGISFSGQMHSLVLLDQTGNPLRNAILWNDVRTTEQCDQIAAEMGSELISLTKNRALEGFTLPKVLWVQKHQPEIWRETKHLLLPKDFLGYYLTGNFQMDYSDAAGTLLLDVAEQTWSEPILTKFGIEVGILPELIAGADLRGMMKPELLAEFGFTKPIKIFGGGADNACAALAAGIVTPELGLASIGTSGVFLSCEPDGNVDYQGKLHFFNHVSKNKHYSMGVTLAAGNSLEWFKRTFADGVSFTDLLAEIGSVKPGSGGLLFTPYIVGERTPYVDSRVRGSFVGIDTHHELKHFTRSVLEGITFSLKDSQMIMKETAGKQFSKIISVGGGAKNRDWLQMQADIFDTPIATLQTEQGPAFGAAMLAGIGCGWFKSEEDAARELIHYRETIYPNSENSQIYQKLYQIYRQVYPQTRTICHELVKF